MDQPPPPPPYDGSRPLWRGTRITSSPHFRHQSSLEGTLEEMLPCPEQFEPHQLKDAKNIFEQIIEYCEPTQTKNGSYKRVSLVRLTYEYAPSQDKFLYHFFKYIEEESTFIDVLSHFANFRDWDIGQKNELASYTARFADFLIENFFLPCKTGQY